MDDQYGYPLSRSDLAFIERSRLEIGDKNEDLRQEQQRCLEAEGRLEDILTELVAAAAPLRWLEETPTAMTEAEYDRFNQALAKAEKGIS